MAARPTLPRIALPAAPCVVAGIGRATILTDDGEVLDLDADAAARIFAQIIHETRTLQTQVRES